MTDLEDHVRRVMAWDLRIARELQWWERLIEDTWFWPFERWEWKTPDGRWVQYWRRNGRLPA